MNGSTVSCLLEGWRIQKERLSFETDLRVLAFYYQLVEEVVVEL